MDWVEAVAALRSAGRAGVLVTVIEVRGHAPRDAGAKMVVAGAQLWGSVGGGNLESTAIERARSMITCGAQGPEVMEFGLTEHAPAAHGRQCCGGQVRVLLEPIAVRPSVAIFGLGHVGAELARILSRLDIHLHLIDSRSAFLGDDAVPGALTRDALADVQLHHSPAPEAVLSQLPAGAHVLVMTHDHAEDIAICDQGLRNPDLGSLGVIGSSAKWSRFRRRLLREGHSVQSLAQIQCPIGVDDIAGKEPAVIAISVAADVLRLLQKGQVRSPQAALATGSAS